MANAYSNKSLSFNNDFISYHLSITFNLGLQILPLVFLGFLVNLEMMQF